MGFSGENTGSGWDVVVQESEEPADMQAPASDCSSVIEVIVDEKLLAAS